MRGRAIFRLLGYLKRSQEQPIQAKLGMLVGTVLGRHRPGGGRYSINIAEDAAKELAGRITNYFESGAR